jgi:hypothetical protein
VGNFLVLNPSRNCQQEASFSFSVGLRFARSAKLQIPNSQLENDWAIAAMFPRKNNSGSPIVIDPGTGSWLLSIGTWFQSDGHGSGDEARLLERYLAVGADRLANELEGFFVVIVGDSEKREIIVITDLAGSCHCFVRPLKCGVAISGSSLVLAALDDFRLDLVGCQEFLRSGVIYEDRTVYQEIKKIGPATVLKLAEGGLKSRQRYWQISNVLCESLDGEVAVGAVWERLVQSAEKVGRLFSNPVCDLTGGYDSRAVAAAFQMAGIQFSTTVSGPKGSADVTVSKEVAQLAGIPHFYVEPQGLVSFEGIKKAQAYTDGEYDIVEYARILDIHQDLCQRFDVSINGSFGEIARGYWWELLFPWTGFRRKMNAEKLAKLRYAALAFDSSLFPPERRLDLVSHFAGIIERTNVGLERFPNTLQMDHAYLTMRMQRWQGRIASSTNQLWPCLSIFSLRSVLETVLMTRASLRRRSLLVRRMLAEFVPKIGNYPLEHGYPAVPVTWRNAHCFYPLAEHFVQKAVEKTLRMVGRKGIGSVYASREASALRMLMGDEEVNHLLDPSRMILRTVIDSKALEWFLSRFVEDNHPIIGLWSRILSLEYSLNVLARARRERPAQSVY